MANFQSPLIQLYSPLWLHILRLALHPHTILSRLCLVSNLEAVLKNSIFSCHIKSLLKTILPLPFTSMYYTPLHAFHHCPVSCPGPSPGRKLHSFHPSIIQWSHPYQIAAPPTPIWPLLLTSEHTPLQMQSHTIN